MIRWTLVLGALIATTPACNRSTAAACARHVPQSSVPVPAGFRLVKTSELPPVGCGADYTRSAVIAAEHGDAALDDFSAALLRASGWRATACVTASERCFRSRRWFVAATDEAGRAAISSQSGYTPDYPAAIGPGTQILALVSRNPRDPRHP